VFTNSLGNDMIQCDAPNEIHPNFAKSPNSSSPLDFSLPLRDPNLLGALHVGNNLIWHPNLIGPIVGLLVHLDGHHLVIFFLLQEIRCGGIFVHLVGVGVRELACLLFLFLLCSSPILHLALIGLVAFLVAYIANHGLSFIKLLHSLDVVILMKLGLLCFAFYLSQVLGKASHFLFELLILHCDLLCACIYNNFLNTNLVAQG